MIEDFISIINNKNAQYVIFDIGSRDCMQSIEFYNHFPNAKIYAFECNPNTIEICKKNIENYLDRITLIEGAVCDYDGTITFYPIDQEKTITSWTDGNPGASSIFKSNGNYDVETYIQYETDVSCHRLDSIMKKYNIPHVDIIWMDLQGAELLALKGLNEHIKTLKYLYTEVSHKEIYTGQAMFNHVHDFMIENNFILKNNISMLGWQEDVIYENKYNDLYTYACNKYSQRGHDGIIEKIMFELNIEKGFFIEFGGWDGIHLSNTRNLFEKGWSGCFIEADTEKFKELQNNYKDTTVICVNDFIYPTNEEGTTIDDVYNKYISNLHEEVDVLSIDIDGRDYEIFENMTIKPKLIIIEGGFAWHPNMKEKIPYDIAQNNIQQPIHVMIECGKSKGYQPICFNQDTFLLRDDLYYKYEYFQQLKNDPYTLWMSAFNTIFNENERQWLTGYRADNPIVRQYEIIS